MSLRAILIVSVLAAGCGGSSKPAPSNTPTSTGSAKPEPVGMCNDDGTCGAHGTCLALCEGKTPGDNNCQAECDTQCAVCPNHTKTP